MPNINPYEAGDDIFQQEGLTRSHKVAANLAIVKGNIYTKNAAGFLVAPSATGSVAALNRGVFQAKTAHSANATAGGAFVQCLNKSAWMILKAPAGIVEGNRVGLATPTATTIDADTCKAVTDYDAGFLGTVYQILTVNDVTDVSAPDERKDVTLAGDLVVVQTGVI